MPFTLSERIGSLPPSATIAISAKARELKAKGVNVISLALGEPDFPSPHVALEGAIAAVKDGQTKYPAVGGMPTFKAAIARKFEVENALRFDASEIAVGNGGKQLIFNAFAATLNLGDEVVIPRPYWVSYPIVVQMFGGQSVHPECHESDAFRLRAEDLEAAITDKTRWLVLNFPNNPTGAILEKADLEEIAAVLRRHPHVNVMSDEIYEHLTFDDRQHVSLLNVAPDLRDRVLIINGMSKAYAMTGWRVGFAAGPADLIRAMTTVQSHATSGVCTLAQVGAAAALAEDKAERTKMCAVYAQRRDRMVAALRAIPGVTCAMPQGAFYVFPGIEHFLGYETKAGRRIETDTDMAEAILEEAHVATVAGSAFGQAGHLRLSVAASDAQLAEAAQRLQEFMSSLKAPPG